MAGANDLEDRVSAIQHMLQTSMVSNFTPLSHVPEATPVIVEGVAPGVIDKHSLFGDGDEVVSIRDIMRRSSLTSKDYQKEHLHMELSMLRVLRDQEDELAWIRKYVSPTQAKRNNESLARRLADLLSGSSLADAVGRVGGGVGGSGGGKGTGKGGTGGRSMPPVVFDGDTSKKPDAPKGKTKTGGKWGRLLGAAAGLLGLGTVAVEAATAVTPSGVNGKPLLDDDLNVPDNRKQVKEAQPSDKSLTRSERAQAQPRDEKGRFIKGESAKVASASVPEAVPKLKAESVPIKPSSTPSGVGFFENLKNKWTIASDGVNAAQTAGKEGAKSGAGRWLSGSKWGILGTAVSTIPDALAIHDVATSDMSKAEKGEKIATIGGGAAGGLAGAAAGGKAGAMLGGGIGALFGGVGAAPGAIVGGLLGSIVGGFAGSELGEKLGKTLGMSYANNVTAKEQIAHPTLNEDRKDAAPAHEVEAERIKKELAAEKEALIAAKAAHAERTASAVAQSGLVTSPNGEAAMMPVSMQTVSAKNPPSSLLGHSGVPNMQPAVVYAARDLDSSVNINGNNVPLRASAGLMTVAARNQAQAEEKKKEEKFKPKMSDEMKELAKEYRAGKDAPRGLTGLDQKSAAESDFFKALANRESGGDYSATNGNYHGAYQLGNAAFKDTGYMNADGTWTGKDNIKSLEDYIGNSDVQDKAAKALMKKNWAYLNAKPIKQDENGKDVYAKDMVGQTLNGVTITESGMLAAAHLGGHASVRTMLSTNGTSMPVDGNNVPIINYMTSMGGKDVEKVTTQPSLVTGNIGTYTPHEEVSYYRAGTRNKDTVAFKTNTPIGVEALQYHRTQYAADMAATAIANARRTSSETIREVSEPAPVAVAEIPNVVVASNNQPVESGDSYLTAPASAPAPAAVQNPSPTVYVAEKEPEVKKAIAPAPVVQTYAQATEPKVYESYPSAGPGVGKVYSTSNVRQYSTDDPAGVRNPEGKVYTNRGVPATSPSMVNVQRNPTNPYSETGKTYSTNGPRTSMYSTDIVGTGIEGRRASDIRTSYVEDYRKPTNITRYAVEQSASPQDIAKLSETLRETVTERETNSATLIQSRQTVPPLTFENVPALLDSNVGLMLINGAVL